MTLARIGDPDEYIEPGEHTYVIKYRIAGVLDPGDVGRDYQFVSATGDLNEMPSVFNWNVVAPGWNNYADYAEVTLTLPGAVSGAQCAVGYGIGDPCDTLMVEEDTVTVAARSLQPHTPVTVRVGVDVALPPRDELPWSASWDPVLGRSHTAPWWAGVFTVLGAMVGWRFRRSIHEDPPPFPVQYGPPEALGPVQVEYIRTESVPVGALTSTLTSSRRAEVDRARRSRAERIDCDGYRQCRGLGQY
ncbi:DUF2207 domain-containing protein [Mycolicibacterium setense]